MSEVHHPFIENVFIEYILIKFSSFKRNEFCCYEILFIKINNNKHIPIAPKKENYFKNCRILYLLDTHTPISNALQKETIYRMRYNKVYLYQGIYVWNEQK